MLSSQILAVLESQAANQWLVNHDSGDLFNSTHELIARFTDFRNKYHHQSTILLIREEPSSFMAAFFAAIALELPIFLGNPHWQEQELQEVKELTNPNLILGQSPQIISQPRSKSKESRSKFFIGIPTGGSSGQIRFAIHTPESLTASAQSFAKHFSTPVINSYCTLPLYHVSGLMQLWRSLITQGKLAIVSYSEIKKGIYPPGDYHDFFLSLVPTQLKFLLDNHCEWLKSFQTILLGGAPAWNSLLSKARNEQLPISLTYGMSETAAGISYLLPSEFLAGNNSSGKILAHTHLKILNPTKQPNSNYQVGTIQIQGDSLYQGYYPHFLPSATPFATDDLGFIDNLGYLHIFGRNSRKIISGGENIYPQEIEAAILATQLVSDVCVIGIEDQQWGQVVSAICVLKNTNTSIATVKQQLLPHLSKFKYPKNWFFISSLPRDSKGKLKYPQVQQIAQNLLRDHQQQV